MTATKRILYLLGCALTLSLAPGCRESLGCPAGTMQVDDLCVPIAEACVETDYYPDADGDGLGAGEPMRACTAPEGYVDNDDDCDDSCAACTGEAEVCDGYDNDCNGTVDDGLEIATYYHDVDGDGHGDPMDAVETCAAPEEYVTSSDDCDDDCDTCFPGQTEDLCDGHDNDCTDGADTAYACAANASVECITSCGSMGMGACSPTCGLPGAAACTPPAETCDGVDEDCDGVVDDGTLGFLRFNGGVLGNDEALVPRSGGHIGILRYNGSARLFTVDDVGSTVSQPAEIANDVYGVDIARGSSAWMASYSDSTGIHTAQITLDAGTPTTGLVKHTYDINTSGLVRVAARDDDHALVVFQVGDTVRIGQPNYGTGGQIAPPATLPGSAHRAALGMDVAALPGTSGYVVAWVSETTPTVNLAIVGATTTTVSANAALGAGTNPVVDVGDDGNVGVAYVGPDGRLRFHHLTPALECVGTDASRDTCARVVSDDIVNNTGSLAARSLGILPGAGRTYWLTTRTATDVLLLRVDADTTHDRILDPATSAQGFVTSLSGTAADFVVVSGGALAFRFGIIGCQEP